jgi:hypothetical protein
MFDSEQRARNRTPGRKFKRESPFDFSIFAERVFGRSHATFNGTQGVAAQLP